MIEQQHLSHRPTNVSPPGSSLAELIEERGIGQAELARRMGRPANAVSEIIQGSKEITEDTALELERVLDTPAHFWLTREARYREFLARRRDADRAPEHVEWLESLPLEELQAIGKLPKGRLTADFKASLIEPALRFFGVASPAGCAKQYGMVQAAFRRANPTRQTDTAAITAWLRLGEIEAQAQAGDIPEYDVEQLRASLGEMRALTIQPAAEIGPRLQSLCRKAGVLLVWIPAFKGTHVSGVARWVGARPLIQMSLRGKWNDVFWFSFFHEIAHILKHLKTAVFLDDASAGTSVQSKEELEADRFAADTLIAPEDRRRLATIRPLTVANVQRFADDVSIHPGIVVGCLQHMKLVPYLSPLTRLKERYEISNAVH